MTSGGNDYTYFRDNQLTIFNAAEIITTNRNQNFRHLSLAADN